MSALSDEVGSDRARWLIERIDLALDTVSGLLDELLDMSKLDAGVWPVTKSRFAVAPILDRLRQEYEPQGEEIGLELRLVPTGAVVYSDARLFERVTRNLISNALRYAETGRVLIGCRRRKNRLRVEVWDTPGSVFRKQTSQEFSRSFITPLPLAITVCGIGAARTGATAGLISGLI